MISDAAPSASNLSSRSTNDEYLAAVTYTSVASFNNHFEKTSHPTPNSSNGTHTVNYGDMDRQSRNNVNRNCPKFSPQMKYLCDICGYNHFKRNKAVCSLPARIKLIESPQIRTGPTNRGESFDGDTSSNEGKKKIIYFNMAKLNKFPNLSRSLVHLVHNGAAFSVIGIGRLSLLVHHLVLQPDSR